VKKYEYIYDGIEKVISSTTDSNGNLISHSEKIIVKWEKTMLVLIHNKINSIENQ